MEPRLSHEPSACARTVEWSRRGPPESITTWALRYTPCDLLRHRTERYCETTAQHALMDAALAVRKLSVIRGSHTNRAGQSGLNPRETHDFRRHSVRRCVTDIGAAQIAYVRGQDVNGVLQQVRRNSVETFRSKQSQLVSRVRRLSSFRVPRTGFAAEHSTATRGCNIS